MFMSFLVSNCKQSKTTDKCRMEHAGIYNIIFLISRIVFPESVNDVTLSLNYVIPLQLNKLTFVV
jgi:hypothetical protein